MPKACLRGVGEFRQDYGVPIVQFAGYGAVQKPINTAANGEREHHKSGNKNLPRKLPCGLYLRGFFQCVNFINFLDVTDDGSLTRGYGFDRGSSFKRRSGRGALALG
jgi:hypothetical protein